MMKQRRLRQTLNTLYVIFSSVALIGVGWNFKQDIADRLPVQAQSEMVSPLPVSTPKPTPTPTPEPIAIQAITPITEKDRIKDYIRLVFGVDAEKAIIMIGTCENGSFDPKAINWNKNATWDAGIFQVNEIHGYTMQQMQDWKQNIDAAYKIYQDAGYTFRPWTCATVIGQTNYLGNN
jgi:hypothetical protein